MMRVPDCRERVETPALSPEDRRELVRRIAEEGVGAIEAFVREREKSDRGIRARIERLRDELLRRAEEMRRALEGSVAARKENVARAWEEAHAKAEAERAALERELQLTKVARAEAERAAVASDDLVRLITEPPPPLPWWRRALAAIGRFLRAVLAAILWPIRALLRALGIVKPRKPAVKGRDVLLPGGLSVPGFRGRLASDPRVRSAIAGRLRTMGTKERMRALWDRLVGREDYEDLAMRLMERDAAERARSRGSEYATREEAFAKRLSEVLDAERAEAERRDAALARLEQEREAEMKRIEASLKQGPERALESEIASELEDAGFLSKDGDAFLPTTRLLERFSQIVFSEEARRIPPGQARATGAIVDGSGNLSREPMRSAYETAHLDVVGTLVNARTRHPHNRHIYEEDVIVHREDREAINHVVIVFDRSGSMEENERLKAAKRAVLALYRAVKDDDPAHIVDVIAMDTGVERVDLMGVWKSEPRGFTNTGAALRLAYDLLRFSKGERALVYLVTDGLPEAYTKGGVDIASTPDKCLAYALEQARLLRRRPGLGVVQILLEPEDELYVKAAERIAKEVDGRVLKASPKDLAATLLTEFETVR
ncbi:MAG TPA: VWA domain-containing protein [Candidatus Thermoplasmatota archaeon]|nr:VWA domain-containing protein [Candidatus Thermoplasmatota archaeon]